VKRRISNNIYACVCNNSWNYKYDIWKCNEVIRENTTAVCLIDALYAFFNVHVMCMLYMYSTLLYPICRKVNHNHNLHEPFWSHLKRSIQQTLLPSPPNKITNTKESSLITPKNRHLWFYVAQTYWTKFISHKILKYTTPNIEKGLFPSYGLMFN